MRPPRMDSAQLTLVPKGVYEPLDGREPDVEFLAASKEYILEQRQKRNRELIEDGFQRDNMSGANEWQRFI